MQLLFIASPVGGLKSGEVGGVGQNLLNIAQEMMERGHQLQIVAPLNSAVESFPIKEISGAFQLPAPNQTRSDPITIPHNGVLTNMWDYARQVQADYDLILNFAYDWLPFYLSPFFTCPVLHFVNMGSWTLAMDGAIERVAHLCPGTLGSHTNAQAATYSVPESFRILGGAIDIAQYEFCPEPGDSFAWAGRITPEKGLEDAFAAADATGINLKIFGSIQVEDYWQQIRHDFPNTSIEYMGFLPTKKFQRELGKCRALLMTHKWQEAFGMVGPEALACGVPIISYRRGGPSEIVMDGQTGWLVEPDSLEDLIAAMKKIDKIDRHCCRQQAETDYSLPAFGDRLEQWFQDVLLQCRNAAKIH